MAAALGSPQPATVIAIGLSSLVAGKQSPPAARVTFANLLGTALANNCHIQPAAGPDEELAFTAIVPDNSQTLSLLRRLQSIQAEFHQIHPTVAARFVVHYGIVFPSAKGYIGSALRSAQSRLLRLPKATTSAATEDFAAHTKTWLAHPISFQKLTGANDDNGLLAFAMDNQANITTPATLTDPTTASAPATLIAYLTTRLANHLGPIAEILVDAAQRSSTSPSQLITELASEIDDLKARNDFHSDAHAFLKSAAN